MDPLSFLSNADPSAIENLYQQYRQDPASVDPSWKYFFEGFEFRHASFDLLPAETRRETSAPGHLGKEFNVLNLIQAYRTRGHLFTRTNPVRERRKYTPTLELENFDLGESDLKTVFQAGNEVGLGPATLESIVSHLRTSYCQSIGVEYMYIRDPLRAKWIRDRVEAAEKRRFSPEEKHELFRMVNKATLFEQYIQKKFVGQKRFSVEGCEAVVPAIDYLVRKGADMGVQEFVLGMAHRGRLNVLTNIMEKPHAEVFAEFEGLEYEEDQSFDGDVKYHYGYSRRVVTDSGNAVHLTLCPNPSHLEAVDPVAEGLTRAKIDRYLKSEDKIVPVLVHGDAAIAAQGVVYELVQMALLDGYRTGGTIHIVTNNQVGFTTNYLDGRSSTYCTDVAKTTLSPVFHVNADDVEAVIRTMEIALDYRMKFHMDVFIDLLGYRKYGHNEGDEPKFTQPSLYARIARHPSLREIYLRQLTGESVLDEKEGKRAQTEFEEVLDVAYDTSRKRSRAFIKHFLEDTWKDIRKATEADFDQSIETGVSRERLEQLGKALNTLPKNEKFFRKTLKVYEDRQSMLSNDKLDWGLAEMLAYATLLTEGHPIRLSGQDVERGTFSHRHAVVKTDEDEEKKFITLNLLEPEQAQFSIYNSLLSEYGVLGFDYGYAFGSPQGLTIWEAQFGDFNNGAQIIIDQFISAAEDKWRTMNGIVLLLPHGYEGQGSEHSSGRMERYLQLCAEWNMQICNCTTPANFFHLMRRQVKSEFRKPLVVFTPKKLLRYPKAVSSVNDLAAGRFSEVVDEPGISPKDTDTLVFCSGKVYYEILEEKERLGITGQIAVIRIEQLYPFPHRQVTDILNRYKRATRLVWCQEEPENMGAWSFIRGVFPGQTPELVSLPASASPATGSPKVHEQRMRNMLSRLFETLRVNA